MPTISFDFRVKQNTDGTYDAHISDQDIHIKGASTQGEALDSALKLLNETWNGIVTTANPEKKLVFTTSIVALRISVEMSPHHNRNLDEFDSQTSEEQAALVLEPVPEEPHNPVTDYANGIPEALALKALLDVDCGGPILVVEAELQCARYEDAAGIPLNLEHVEARYPQLINRFEEPHTLDDGLEEVQYLIEFDTEAAEGDALYQQMNAALDPAEIVETPEVVTND